MKEIISAVIFFVGIYSGTIALKAFHNLVKKLALEKAPSGMPSLVEMHRALQTPKPLRQAAIAIIYFAALGSI